MTCREIDELNRRVRDLESRVGMLEAKVAMLRQHVKRVLKEEAEARETMTGGRGII